MKIAKALLALGVKRGDTIAMVMNDTSEYVLMFMAASSIGAVFTVCRHNINVKTKYIELSKVF